VNRTAKLILAVLAAIGAAAVVLFASGVLPPGPGETRAESDSVWYHTSDVALLARTNRPQLVEFFHPG
jgi:hypothetical protein